MRTCTTGPDCNLGHLHDAEVHGAALFGTPVLYAAQGGPSKEAIADIDGDGELDVAVTNSTQGSISVFYGNGMGAFTTAYNVG